ncbi:MAG: DUF2141 domain-containing protein [Candidatus Binataceae bacterium]
MTKPRLSAWLIALMFGIFAAYPAIAQEAAVTGVKAAIHVHVIKLRNNKGQVGCSIWNSPKGFPKAGMAVKGEWAPIQDHQARCTFSGLPPGTYAVAILHDENSNGKMDKSMLGIPKEGWGFSKDAPIGLRGPPSFQAASFPYKGGTLDLMVNAKYWP